MADIAPCQSVYVSNLNEKTNKQELRRSLYTLFAEYGRVMDVVALKTRKMRGQAHVVFTDLSSATSAVRAANGAMLYGRPMRVSYAKSKSYAVMKEDGTYGKEMRKRRQGEKAGPAAHAAAAMALESSAGPAAEMETEEKEAEAASAAAPGEDGDEPTNSILFVGGLPDGTTPEMLQVLFQQISGFREVRQVGGRPDIAFIEYETEGQAAEAKYTLHGFKIDPTHAMSITYAKK
mmetsp:Transcript_10949/g.28170  ORF Transcript_10949/g.28170 Transcript_10949/m.28170 type:complete len:234 (-) Transcript_10949:339-1040(-)|eukprot:CAMPEP_0182921964 /NCGR_PEP_ID=MMETSP0105_2-20130417/4495_1 /TAXON_ID=81532 ORGANISM="Acanthoeca-like sp., Strain 10tr" /NCGR_SAMPLE_ID=MMETSP0105_2 /ASSEMBLY_ACC=CAM_ASM_000205 /LENGTH=233 /DNA_ID=CAMNT_0025059545 /DNA_START=63 /DNA_END=764 /DNA_ORIENTATION=-